MHQNSFLVILFLSLIFLPIIFSDAGKTAPIGVWMPIKNIKDPHVTEIAEFAVREHNKESKASLKLDEVVKGETRVVIDTIYHLILKAKDGNTAVVENTYEAIVQEGKLVKSKELLSFMPV